MDRALVAILAFVGAAVVVLGAAAVWLTVTDDDDPPVADLDDEPDVIEGVSFPPIDHDDDAAAGLLEAWERWRTATFVSIGTWTRTVDGVAEPLTGDVYTAQAPPRRLVVRLGAVVERFDGMTAACSPVEEDVIAPPCLAGPGLGYDELVERELALVAEYVGGSNRLYDVASDGACFQAELIGAALASPWGRWAEFCFEESGALQSARIRRPSAIDIESIHTIRTDVTDADFG